MEKAIRFWQTVKHLKFIQVFYQFRNRLLPKSNIVLQKRSDYEIKVLKLIGSKISLTECLKHKNTFQFLNITHSFDKAINWDCSNYGKLWAYNLTYFDFLNQPTLDKEEGLGLIIDYIIKLETTKDGNESYPISLRSINWIKFVVKHKIKNEQINDALFSQYKYLINNLEYHLLGNHLLENAFSLLFGAYYFQDVKFYRKAKSLLEKQLDEQILNDGGHFELSPMYHKILLFRLLDSINIIESSNWQNDNLRNYLDQKAKLMLGWLEAITYSNGSTPNVNDSIDGIAPSTTELLQYAKSINLKWKPQLLKESGYRFYKKTNYELLVDVGNIGPNYIPGHAHADTFNFELMVDGKPIIVDTGISTYEKNNKRQLERSTISHNTLIVNSINQSDVWGGFRVGKRANIIKLEESNGFIQASHNGYKELGITHTRSFQTNKNEIIIKDLVVQKSNQDYVFCSILHFHPNVSISKKESSLFLTNPTLEIIFIGVDKIEIDEFEYCEGFNKTKVSSMALIYFNKSLTTKILLK